MNFDTSIWFDSNKIKNEYWTATGMVINDEFFLTSIIREKKPIENLIKDGYTFKEINKINLENSL